MKNEKNINKLVHLHFDVNRLIHCEMMKGVVKKKAPFDPISLLRIHTMRFVRQSKENPTMQDVAEYLHITPSSATSLVSGLVKAGFIKRVKETKDRRTVRLVLTSKGRGEIKKKRTFIIKQMKKVFSKLSVRDIKILISILEKL